ncbi:AAA family ATPase [Nesterenkonia muleiensis]|uniref:AAA family ATPase n=1 Tax=Nesterenkonia muleiensis TaxID=2282648 RepID=UPI000E749826|nr:AAA family ATPase [Nesterenkonia muleiensis]
MPDLSGTIELLTRYTKARVPVVVVRTQEPSRALDAIRHAAAGQPSMPYYAHSPAKGLGDLMSGQAIIDDRSLNGALDYATRAFEQRNNVNVVLLDVDDLEQESSTSRHLAEVARVAEARAGSLTIVTDKTVWSGLARLGMTVQLDLPSFDEIFQVVSGIVEDHRANPRFAIDWQYDEMRRAAEILHGVTETEALNIIASLLAKETLLNEDLAELSSFKDQIFGGTAGIERIALRESDAAVGGLTTLQEWLGKREQRIKDDLSGTNLRPPRGVMLVGVPGCGKSLSAKAIAQKWSLPLYRLDMGAVFGQYVGQSESRLREALDAADRVAPCVLWIDEIEKGLAGAGSESTGITTRLIGQFLFWLQESRTKVFTVATANDVRSLPPELLRKGRFDEIFFVDLPDDHERAEIIQLYFQLKVGLEPSPLLLDELVGISAGFAGADLAATIEDVAWERRDRNDHGPIDDELVTEAFQNVVPFSKTNPEEVASIRQWGLERAIPANGRTLETVANPLNGSPRRVVL